MLWTVAVISALLQGSDAWTTYYGLYIRKPALIEGDLKSWNLLLVKNKLALLTIKPAVTFAIGAAIAISGKGQTGDVTIYGMLPGIILGAVGALFGILNLKLILK